MVRHGMIPLYVAVLTFTALGNTSAVRGQCVGTQYLRTISLGSSSTDVVYDIVVDEDDSVLLLGQFSATVDFDTGAGVDFQSATANPDLFISRYDGNGTYDWTGVFGGPPSECIVAGGELGDGGALIAGDFNTTIDLDPTSGIDERVSKDGAPDVYVNSVTANGAYTWGLVIAGEEHQELFDLDMDPNDEVFIAGKFDGRTDFDATDGVDEHSPFGSEGNAYLTKLFTDGSYGWTRTFGGLLGSSGSAVASDSETAVFICGTFEGIVDFDPSEELYELEALGQADVYLSKFNDEGNWLWTVQIGGLLFDGCAALSAVGDNSVLIAGVFQDAVDFDPTSGIDLRTSNGLSDTFVTRIGSDGSYEWTWTAGGFDGDATQAIDADDQGNVVLTGCFGVNSGPPGYQMDFDPGPGEDIHTTKGGDDIFVTYLKADGSYGWTWTVGGVANDLGHTVKFSNDGRIFVGGQYQGTVDFDPTGSGDVRTSQGGTDAFWTTLQCIEDPPVCEGDANGDFVVDPLDAGYILARFGCAVGSGDGLCDKADVNGDSLVDPLDVGFVLSRFGDCP